MDSNFLQRIQNISLTMEEETDIPFRFKLESQLQWVVDNGPWSFDNHLLVIRRWEKEAANDIGRGLGQVLEVNNTAFSIEQARFLWVKVKVPLAQPLLRKGLVVSSEGDRSWVAFKYERIVSLCFAYGKLGHEMRACTHPNPGTGLGEMPYGEWLKAGGQRTPTKNNNTSSSPLKQAPPNQGPPWPAPPSPSGT
ncbi:hypothetical protein SO802_026749 [Lithocarpus litseifolius]|uniref:Zinc knuckle CX2CX4HX4C domain-containing protein n=1 Tax=Lithocarpus litseifolius TaxID=425828 RepID=A0AAW2C0N0_9ROSI